MKPSALEKQLMNMYRSMPNMAIHGMRLDYLEWNRSSGIIHPEKKAIFYYLMGGDERELKPEEFIMSFKRSIFCSVDYALADLPKYIRNEFMKGEVMYECAPAVLFMSEKRGFYIFKECAGESYSSPIEGIVPGQLFSEGAKYGCIPEENISAKVFLSKAEAGKLGAEIARANSDPMVSPLGKILSAETCIHNRIYRKALNSIVHILKENCCNTKQDKQNIGCCSD